MGTPNSTEQVAENDEFVRRTVMGMATDIADMKSATDRIVVQFKAVAASVGVKLGFD